MNKRRCSLLFRLLLSAILIGALAHHAGSEAIVERVRSVPWYTLVSAIVILGTSFLFVTPRWTLILAAFGHRVRVRDLTGSVLVGFLFNQLLPTAVGGEVVRIWRARQLGVSLDIAIYSVVVDRASGVFVSLVWAALLLPFASPLSGKGSLGWILNAVALLGVLGATVLWSIKRMSPPRSPILAQFQTSVSKIWTGLDAIVGSPGRLFSIAALACINQGLLVATVWLFANSLNPGLNLADIALITFVSTVAATLPLSFAGWGIREATLVYLFSLYGVSPDIALAISILYGVSVAIAAAPGALFLIPGFKQSPDMNGDLGETQNK